MASDNLTRFAWLSVAAALVTIGLKLTAYFLTDSVGMLSDALESLVNLVAALLALFILTIAARPLDELHAYGHGKAEYFSSGIEGALIIVAAVSIIWTAVPRLISPQPIEQVGLGLGVSTLASIVNFGVARVLMRAGRQHQSITLEADAHHLMTDVWTSAGVLVGVAAVALTGWQRLDPIIALVVAVNIIWTGIQLIRRSTSGLMDTAISEEDKATELLRKYEQQGVQFHALRSRRAGAYAFLSVHVLVPGEWTVERGHQLVEQIEEELEAAIPGLYVLTHLEPLDDPAAQQDVSLGHRTQIPPTETSVR
jgi:cation diffusion facilitator family transporter